MVEIENLAIIFALMAFNTIFLLIKRKDFATITVHLILMLFTFIIGATIIFPDNSVFAVFLMFYSVTCFIGQILMVRV